MGKRITEQTIKRMKPPASGQRIEWDSETKGFGVRITSAGAISFILDYYIFGRHRRYTIGRYPALNASTARRGVYENGELIVPGADDLKARIRAGIDPMEERRELRNEPTLSDLLDDYLQSDELAKKRPNTLRDYKRMAEKIIRPKLGRLRLKAINKRDIAALHAALKDTPYQANRVLALLSSMFSYAIEEEWLSDNPAKGIERYPEEKRDRYLNKEDSTEIARFTKALDDYPNQVIDPEARADRQAAANALRLLLLTGSRMSEVLKATWEQFDLNRGVWTKPSHHTKQKKTEHVPLSAPALDLLNSMKPSKARGPLFAGRDGKKARVTIRRPWVQACKAAGLVEVVEVEGKRKMPDGRPRMLKQYKPTVRIHDLRHTYASHLASSGVSLQIIGKLIGHTQAATTMRYAHLQDESLRTATEQFGKIIHFPTESPAPAKTAR